MKLIMILCCRLSLVFLSSLAMANIADTKHNLSVSGSGNIRAETEQQICIFCHTPHSASPVAPLWNRPSTGNTYIPYSSSTALASPGQPTGASLLCLSCHDGTIALGNVLSSATDIALVNNVTTMPAGATRLSTDLSDDHPVSFDFTASLASQRGELVNPDTLLGPVKLDKNGQMQCTSCHDPHNNQNGKFLVKANTASALCRSCHIKNGWTETSHSTSSKSWDGTGTNPWPTTTETTVAANACENCHTPHNAGGHERILKYAAEEDNCLVCHNGHVASKNIAAEFNKISRHPIFDNTGVHDPAESVVVNQRHAECQDCHNPHAANQANPLNGVRGVNQQGSEIPQVSQVQELCYRCHGDSANKPAARTPRLTDQTNVRIEFDTINPSYHPVAGVGKNPNVPSLLPPLNTASRITCLSCHNADDNPATGGNGPNGPHGSNYEPILERQYLTQDPTTESASTYALCYKCHDRNSILGNQSFPRHNLHITGSGMGRMFGLSTPCNVCHDPHGVTNNVKLINFDTSVVSPNRSGLLKYESLGTFAGRCYLNCHGMEHNPKTYGTGGGGMGR